MARTKQTQVTGSDEVVEAVNKLDSALQDLKGTDAWFDEVESLNASLGLPNVMDRELHRRVASNMVTFYAQQVVEASSKNK
jgi:hypothetical protein